jgi:O-antigen ligase
MTKEIEATWASKILFFLLCATIIFTALAYGTVHQPTLAVFYLLAVIVGGLWAADAFFGGVLRFPKSWLLMPLFAAFLYALVQIIPFGSLADLANVADIPRTISLDPFGTRVAALHFFALLIFFAALLTYLDSAKRLRKIVGVITIFGFGFAFFAILQGVLSPSKIYGIYEVSGHPYGSFVNRHNFAAYMEMTMCLPLGLMFAGAVGKDRKLLYITAIGLMGVALLLSGSRGGLIALLAAVFFLIILTTKSGNTKQMALKIGLSVLLIATIIVGSALIGGESSLTRIAEEETSATSRTHIWNVTLSVIANHLPLGAGFGAFAVAYTPFDTLNGLERVEQAHNDYLEVLATGGIVGLMIGGFFLFQLFRTGFRHAESSNTFRRGVCVGALAGCFAILVHSLFDFVLHTTAIAMLFITLVSLVAVSGIRFPDDRQETEPRDSRKRRSANVTPFDKERRKRLEKA